jgi:hypothetical protein
MDACNGAQFIAVGLNRLISRFGLASANRP